ncbi:GGDEF domain-containing protein [Comamonas sp. w2-DMI]|uniref:transporter substrate-binding domain-containing diguanylate cyclase n=1 Tax=Comamonas sp. w2-DMI TaxID=3126391 RepID=UPI0032E37E22
MVRGLRAARLGLLWAAGGCMAWGCALACEGPQHVHLLHPVALSAAEQAEFRAMAPLRVLAVDAPPMARYDRERNRYAGIGVDVWCFIAAELGLRYEILPDRDMTVADKIRQVQQGRADVFLPLSQQPDRARLGLFTLPYYASYYAIIARTGRRLQVHGLDDLAPYRVGVVKGVALEPRLQAALPASRLTSFDQANSNGMFQALLDGALDVAVFNKSIFDEKRYAYDYFDLEVIHTLRDDPREYSFYFSPTPEHRRLVEVFNRYLGAIDASESVAQHEKGDRQLIERYVAQRSQRTLLQVASVAAVLMMLVFGLAFLRYRRLARLLAQSNRQILEQQQALREANEQLARLSLCDELTGLANRRAFGQALQREHARRQRTGAPLSMLVIDVDHFKCVNDHYGHATGDDYLRSVAQVLSQAAGRAADLAARHGGEEFACLLPDTPAADALALAERIRMAAAGLALPNALAAAGRLTVSIGVATLEAGPATAQDLLAEADAQLYAAKRAGRDCVRAAVVRA